MYFGASAFLITVGIILIVAPRDSTRTLPLDLIGIVLIAVGAAGLLVNLTKRLSVHRTRTRLNRTAPPVRTADPPRHRRRTTKRAKPR